MLTHGSELPVIPRFPVAIEPPDVGRWRAGNTGVAGFTTACGARPGPHVVVLALMHGNELGGAVVLDRLLERLRGGGLRVQCGRLTVGFANLDAYARFDATEPTASRFVDEDLNRVWDPAVLDGPRMSVELQRARAMRPVIDTADMLLDLHSMLWPSDPLILSGASVKGRGLASALGVPSLVVADHGHQTGPRVIDYPRFSGDGTEAAACLVEAGQHWQPGTVDVMQAAADALLTRTVLGGGPLVALPTVRCAEVTRAVTAATSSFAFVQAFRGGDVVPLRNTLIAVDGTAEIRTPYDDCLLVMPTLRASRGHTAVRLAKFV